MRVSTTTELWLYICVCVQFIEQDVSTKPTIVYLDAGSSRLLNLEWWMTGVCPHTPVGHKRDKGVMR